MSGWLSTHSNSLANPESISVTASCSPPFLPAPEATRTPRYSLGHSWQVTAAPACITPSYEWVWLRFFPPAPLHVQAWVWEFPTLGGEGVSKLLSLTQLSSNIATAASVVSGTTPGKLHRLPIKPPYCPFPIVLCTLWLLNSVSAKILWTVHFTFWKISYVSQLGARASGFSSTYFATIL